MALDGWDDLCYRERVINFVVLCLRCELPNRLRKLVVLLIFKDPPAICQLLLDCSTCILYRISVLYVHAAVLFMEELHWIFNLLAFFYHIFHFRLMSFASPIRWKVGDGLVFNKFFFSFIGPSWEELSCFWSYMGFGGCVSAWNSFWIVLLPIGLSALNHGPKLVTSVCVCRIG